MQQDTVIRCKLDQQKEHTRTHYKFVLSIHENAKSQILKTIHSYRSFQNNIADYRASPVSLACLLARW